MQPLPEPLGAHWLSALAQGGLRILSGLSHPLSDLSLYCGVDLTDVNERLRTEADTESIVFNVLSDIKNTGEHLKTAILA